jgi:cell division septation protein DedD
VKRRLNPQESITLYGVLVGFIFIFYILGLFIGKNQFVEARANDASLPLSETPVENLEPDVEPELDFYQRVTVPDDPEESRPSEEVAPVPEQATREKTSAPVEEPKASTVEAYTVQVGAFTRKVDARQILVRLEAKGHFAVVRNSTAEDPVFRVWVGEFKTPQQAAEKNELLRQEGFSTYIRKILVVSPTP